MVDDIAHRFDRSRPVLNAVEKAERAPAPLIGLTKHDMFVADNGIAWAISVAPDERIPDMSVELRKIKGSAFEVAEKPK